METAAKAKRIAQVCVDKKARDVITIEITKLTTICDFFVICTANSDIQSRAIADGIAEALEGKRLKDRPRAGLPNGEWLLLDYGDVVAHIMRESARDRYKLEDFWRDGKFERYE
jgi:ribosome-associated protein